jgi:hypothetical protein
MNLPPEDGAPDNCTEFTGIISGVPETIPLPFLSECIMLLASKESVEREVLAWARKAIKRRIMTKTFTDQELDDLLEVTKEAGRAVGYAQAKLEMALERSKAGSHTLAPVEPAIVDDVAAKREELKVQAHKIENEERYKTRQTVAMTKAIALDYIKSVAPQIVGPSEIIKNTRRTAGVFISFGTLNRAMDQLVETGEAEQIERSRWRYKGRADVTPLKSVR